MHFRIAAEAVGAHGDGLDHGAIAADDGAVLVQPRPALVEDRDIGGRAADVGNHGIVETGQEARADKARRRAGKDGLDRTQARLGGRDQRAVAAHHHQRRIDAARLEEILRRADQPVDHRHQPGIEQGGERAPGSAELGGKLMAAGDGQMRPRANEVAHAELVLGVAHREIAGDGEGGHGAGKLIELRGKRVRIERRFMAMHIMPAGKEDHRIGAERLPEPVAFEIVWAEADHDQTDAPALAFDQRIGRQRGGKRGEPDRRGIGAGFGQHILDGAPDALRKVVPGGQRLGARLDPVLGTEENRVGISTARIDAEKKS